MKFKLGGAWDRSREAQGSSRGTGQGRERERETERSRESIEHKDARRSREKQGRA